MTRPTIQRSRFPRFPKQKQPINNLTQYEQVAETLRALRDLRANFEKEWKLVVQKAERQIAQVQKGDPGKDAPDLKTIVNAVLPLIQTPKDGKDGHTPTEKELLAIIKPLIPKVKDGKSPDIDTIARTVLARIKQPKFPVLDEIVNAVLKALEGKLKIDDIKGLRTELRSIASKAALGSGSGGGGMGNIVPFTLEGDGTTTEFTLPAKPTQNGLAIMAHYQGQYLHTATHFEVSGDTITFTFVPDNGTFIEGFLIT